MSGFLGFGFFFPFTLQNKRAVEEDLYLFVWSGVRELEVNPSCPSCLWVVDAWRENEIAKPSQGLEGMAAASQR